MKTDSLPLQSSVTRRAVACAALALCGGALAQSGPSAVAPLRTAPTERFTVNLGFRDWGPTTIAGTTILGGNSSSSRCGLYAVDMLTGKVKWTSRPRIGDMNPCVSTAPIVFGDIVITIMADTLVALSLATGKEVWRGPATRQSATAAVSSGLVYVLGDDANFYALEVATGRERWKVGVPREGHCHALPIVRDGTVYLSRAAAEGFEYLFALDANTGKERWQYPEAGSRGDDYSRGACLLQPIITADTYFGVHSQALHAVNLATGRKRWKPVRVNQLVDGHVRGVPIGGLVDASSVVIGMTPGSLVAFDKATGQIAWEIAGQYAVENPSTAVAGRVLYFQGHPGAEPTGRQDEGRILYQGGRPVVSAPTLPRGRLNALDLDTRTILWSFSRPTRERNWPFGFVTPVEGGLWVNSYQALVKLQ